MKKLFIHPIFLIGLAIRIFLIINAKPFAPELWYAPFLDLSITSFSLNPWSAWIDNGGSLIAFPYGYVMWLIFLPLMLFTKFVALSDLLAYQSTLLIIDISLLFAIYRLFPSRPILLLASYWLSPIIIFSTYGLGLNDLIPVLFLFLSLIHIERMQLTRAGFLLIAAISAKLSMLVTFPFFLIYLLSRQSLRQHFFSFLLGITLGFLVLIVPYLLSSSGILMLINTPDLWKISQLKVELNEDASISLVPLIYFIMLYFIWRVRRLNFDLFQATMGITLLLVVLLTPSSPGWFVWCIPFLTLYQLKSDWFAFLLVGIFSCLYLLSSLLTTQLIFINEQHFSLINYFHFSNDLMIHFISLLHTAMFGMGLILIIRVWRESISKNDFFRLSRKPFVLGVAGDSGSGKDTFVNAVAGLFGNHSVVKLSGDDYHLWDRKKPMWKVMTHLNPMANDLERFTNDLLALIDGKSIFSRNYNHKTGKMSKPFLVKSNDFIIASGLHALYLPLTRESYNLSIYLDINEDLRKHFKLKRDIYDRGHTIKNILNSLKKRMSDSANFIQPQANHADLVFSLQPVSYKILKKLNNNQQPLQLKLIIHSKNGFNQLSIQQVLVGICGLHVENNNQASEMTIEGEVSSEEIAMAIKILCPNILEFLDKPPKWQSGMLGIMQLITIFHINQSLNRRFI
jgi:uridine kinase